MAVWLSGNNSKNSLVKKNSRKVKLGYLNINSIRNKFIALRSVLDDDMDVLAIAETKIDESFPTSQIHWWLQT